MSVHRLGHMAEGDPMALEPLEPQDTALARAERAEAALEDLIDCQHDYPTDTARRAPEWAAAFDRARDVLRRR